MGPGGILMDKYVIDTHGCVHETRCATTDELYPYGAHVEKMMYRGFHKSEASDVAEVLEKARFTRSSLKLTNSSHRLLVTKVNSEWAVDLPTGNILYEVMMEGDIV